MRIAALLFAFALSGCVPVETLGDGGETTADTSSMPVPAAVPASDAEAEPLSRADFEAAMAPNAAFEIREAFVDRLPTVTIDDEGTARTRILWEGDQLLTRAQVFARLAAADADASTPPDGELRVMVDGFGRPAFWGPKQRNLTYWLNARTFRNEQEMGFVRMTIANAARDWEAVCTDCKLTIRETSNPGSATFKVQFLGGDQPFVAAAFFPNDPAWRRVLYIGQDFLTTTFSQTGIMRHELGHVLGYRHEHIGGVSGCYREDQSYRMLTDYDPKSVMHYFCGGGGTRELNLSENDKIGHRRLYSWSARR